ncbi:hypothetical protein PPYR_13304 [Photinus pyralis]|uniref:Uncharacterized protein n=1 Tax=Photinus pyralis TaxID=7054 RepID=A0A5N4A8P4_PHOPY|nr:uncharacterized protein LOC116177875 [Photinus pyralis]KAB0793684.1 hypothetical protein PPYR_13304 [Photinus pyralis]
MNCLFNKKLILGFLIFYVQIVNVSNIACYRCRSLTYAFCGDEFDPERTAISVCNLGEVCAKLYSKQDTYVMRGCFTRGTCISHPMLDECDVCDGNLCNGERPTFRSPFLTNVINLLISYVITNHLY